jgi:hypothetical protein
MSCDKNIEGYVKGRTQSVRYPFAIHTTIFQNANYDTGSQAIHQSVIQSISRSLKNKVLHFIGQAQMIVEKTP